MNTKRLSPATRRDVLELLTDAENASVRNGESIRLSEGEEYLDLQHLEVGVRRAIATTTVTGNALAKRAVHPDTWRKILARLADPETAKAS